MKQTQSKDSPSFIIKMSPFLRNTFVGLLLALGGYLGTLTVQTFRIIYQNQTQIQFIMEEISRDRKADAEKFQVTLDKIADLRRDLITTSKQIEKLQDGQNQREKDIGQFYQKYSPGLEWSLEQSKK